MIRAEACRRPLSMSDYSAAVIGGVETEGSSKNGKNLQSKSIRKTKGKKEGGKFDEEFNELQVLQILVHIRSHTLQEPLKVRLLLLLHIHLSTLTRCCRLRHSVRPRPLPRL